jgi:hypothetical protein
MAVFKPSLLQSRLSAFGPFAVCLLLAALGTKRMLLERLCTSKNQYKLTFFDKHPVSLDRLSNNQNFNIPEEV